MTTTSRSPEQPARPEAVRALWRLIEVYHALVYFAPERSAVYDALGLKGGWMGYFATRSAALGTPPADVVTACFYGFAPRMVERALPDAWTFTTPSAALAARLQVFDKAMRRLVGDLLLDTEERSLSVRLGARLGDIVDSLPSAGAPLFAAHRASARPDAPHLYLFWATTALREYRGDAHVAALRAASVDPVESNALMAALGLAPPDQRRYRGWTEAEWADAADRLRARGWLDADGHVTPLGHQDRTAIEALTDTMTARAWEELSDGEVRAVGNDLSSVAGPIITSGAVPYPNGMGMAPMAERRSQDESVLVVPPPIRRF